MYYYQADALMRYEQPDLAIKDYKQAMSLCPDDADLVEDYESALCCVKQVLNLGKAERLI
ncbi:MAG: hypothetical protein ACFFCW_08715 [Candidatus Hodarchaeota archaeon]